MKMPETEEMLRKYRRLFQKAYGRKPEKVIMSQTVYDIFMKEIEETNEAFKEILENLSPDENLTFEGMSIIIEPDDQGIGFRWV